MSNQQNLTVKIKKLVEQAVIPTYANPGDAGLDLTATSKKYNSEHEYMEYGTGLSIQLPEGYVGLIFPRSSISKTPHLLTNSAGVLDAQYLGEIKFRFKVNYTLGNVKDEYKIGDRIGQLIIMPYPKINFEIVYKLEGTQRGTGGFGSSGK